MHHIAKQPEQIDLGLADTGAKLRLNHRNMGLIFAIIVAGGMVMVAFHYWGQLCDHEQLVGDEWHLFLRWVLTGLLVPSVLWFVFNLGIVGAPVWPNVTPVNSGISFWWKSFDKAAAAAIFLISSYWGGVTFLWLLARIYTRVADRGTFIGLCAAWSLLLVPAAVVLILISGWGATGMAMMLCGVVLVHTTLTLKTDKALAPSYSLAEARISFGKYEEAEMAIIRELEQCEEDFDGWMMLATLYAAHFNDLPVADQTIRDLCAQPLITPVQLGIALNRLADWHLKLGHDPIAARKVLELLCARTPGTHLEKMARQRIDRLPATREALLEQERGKPLHLPPVSDELDVPAPQALSREQAASAANECVDALQRNPDDVVAREKFARLLAENLGDVTVGIEQLELLLAMANQPVVKRARWLLTIATWHAHYRNDPTTAKLVYQEVMRDFPNSTQAFAAQRRLNLINLQAQFRRRFAERAATA